MKEHRLPRNFHKSFKPERQYIAAMMKFAASGYSGNFQRIADETGIPMGASSGKVPAILDYCRGMGLLDLSNDRVKSSTKEPKLTNFGRAVYLEDPYLKCEITQWISHMNLCKRYTGADVWFETFFQSALTLGTSFRRDQFEQHLSVVYGHHKGRNLIGPMIGMYQDSASFKRCGAIDDIDGRIVKRSAPIVEELVLGYGAWILQLIEEFFLEQCQVPITQLDQVCGWSTIPVWSSSDIQVILDLLTKKGVISLDRSMEPWLIQPRMSSTKAWENIYSDMI